MSANSVGDGEEIEDDDDYENSLWMFSEVFEWF
jgi:hypothetical protein